MTASRRMRIAALTCLAGALLAACPSKEPVAAPPASDPLGRYGRVPRCVASFEIAAAPAGSDEDHQHAMAPVPRLDRLAGLTPTLAPMLEDPDARVVHRALDLLCSVQDEPAQAAIASLVARRPCVSWIRQALGGAGVAKEKLPPALQAQLDDPAQKEACERDDVPSLDCTDTDRRTHCSRDPFDPRLRPSYAAWANPASAALAKRLSAGEEAAFAEALAALDAMDRARARTAVAALAAIDGPEGWLKLVALCRTWAGRRGGRVDSPTGEFARGIGGAALERVAAKAGRSPSEQLLAFAETAPNELLDVLFGVGPWVDKGFLAAVHAARAKGGKGAALAARMERHEYLAAMGSGKREPLAAESEAAFKASDKDALRRTARSAEPRRFQRLVAAYYLAQLGEADDLDLFEQVELVQPEEIQGLRQALEELATKTSGPVREKVEKLLPRWREADQRPSKADLSRAANALGGD